MPSEEELITLIIIIPLPLLFKGRVSDRVKKSREIEN
jgi:hypothetical protein